jgi:hypothetical protein
MGNATTVGVAGQTMKAFNELVIGTTTKGSSSDKVSKDDSKLPDGERYFGFVNVSVIMQLS